MTIETCNRLLKHYEETGNDLAAEDMKRNIAYKEWRLANPNADPITFKYTPKSEKTKKSEN